MRSWKISFIMVWNVAGLFVNPKNITSSFPLVAFLDLDIVVPPVDIEFGEVLCTVELIDEVRNEW
jgi:hypothetical protein